MIQSTKQDIKGATFSEDRVYRYDLWRTWEVPAKRACWILLNPSTADESQDDNTIRRVITFTRDFGYGGCNIVNLFGLRSTNPKGLKMVSDPIGLDNDFNILLRAKQADVVICAWGTHGRYLDRDLDVWEHLLSSGVELYCLGRTKEGYPKHPLYLPRDVELHRFV